MIDSNIPVQVDEGYGGANFIFKGYFSTMGMSILWPLRALQRRSTGRWYANLVTDKPEAVCEARRLPSTSASASASTSASTSASASASAPALALVLAHALPLPRPPTRSLLPLPPTR